MASSTNWDVFLSFRGEDTRYNFTSHLYSALDRCGVRTFMDDPELRTGDVISDALLEAIQESKTYIVILSENYASSSWCLDELEEILRCNRTMHRLIIPVFYKIDPAILRRQTGKFEQAFEKHESRLAGEMERVKNWRLMLREVADKSGKHISEKRSEADIISEIVEEILLDINPRALDVAKYPVGLDSHVKGITSLLSSDTKGVTKIGIYGMGGVGKTTLAKALFNELLLRNFNGSSFLANVREIWGTIKGVETLQEQLINDVLKSKKKVTINNVDQGTKLIAARICLTKVLMVIDDLDDSKQFDSLVGPFAPGSVVILTTRDEEILDKIEVETKYRYRVNELDDAEALELFCQHAFGNTKPESTFMILSKDILRHAGGLPLALEVFGSYLYKRSEVGWKSYIGKLQRIPNSSIQQRLIISLDALESDDPMLKKIFLDIACFFIGKKKESVLEIMDTYYPYTDHNIDILRKRCLLSINDRDELRMHDLLQDMGRETARNNSPDEPGKHSRLWVTKEIYTVLKKHEGTKSIEVIIPRYLESNNPIREVSFDVETFRRMSKLRFLHLKDISLTGNFEETLEDLTWLCWDRCPLECLPFEFYPQELVTLELPRSRMRTIWELNMVSHVFKNLKTLKMSHSPYLTTTSDFTGLPCLETLNLEDCESLTEVHMSIGSLMSLVTLYLPGCRNLRSLPDTICNLRALKSLNIDDCGSLEALPIGLGNIESLTELNASGINVSELPDSIGRLSKLVKLILNSNDKLKTLPDTMCNLRALEFLSIDRCTSLGALPIELGNIESLTQLSAMSLNVWKLPDSIGRLSKLVKLMLYHNVNLKSLPDTICDLRSLKVLGIGGCSSLEELPIDLGNIESLTELDAYRVNVSKLPDSVGRLSKLVRLILKKSVKLESLPDTVCHMRSMEILDIGGCEKLEKLPDQLWKLTRLRELYASGASLLKNLPDVESAGHFALSLQKLNLSETSLMALPSSISQFPNLEEVTLTNCGHLLFITELPPSLKWLRAYGCTYMERLPNLSNLERLEMLDLSYCSALTEIQGLEELAYLRKLHLRGCKSSLLACTLTKRFFQIHSGFGHHISICIGSNEFPEWINQSSEYGPTMSLDLQPNVSPNYLGMILCFQRAVGCYCYILDFSAKTLSTNFTWSDTFHDVYYDSCIVVVPRSIFSVGGCDNRIEVISNGDAAIFGIHLLSETEITSTRPPLAT
ncbi:TMV resistance protein N-like [Apium graveolens]|uniref:TMV resistance protein N-like n=1 Tax=Apium graveolens TaxID=4045 RepID=UPI003D7BB383